MKTNDYRPVAQPAKQPVVSYALKSTLVAVRQAQLLLQNEQQSMEAVEALRILEHVGAVLDAYLKAGPETDQARR